MTGFYHCQVFAMCAGVVGGEQDCIVVVWAQGVLCDVCECGVLELCVGCECYIF